MADLQSWTRCGIRAFFFFLLFPLSFPLFSSPFFLLSRFPVVCLTMCCAVNCGVMIRLAISRIGLASHCTCITLRCVKLYLWRRAWHLIFRFWVCWPFFLSFLLPFSFSTRNGKELKRKEELIKCIKCVEECAGNSAEADNSILPRFL